jgi:ATP-dependent RNA helicase RhlE
MLDMGFVHDVKKVLARLPSKRQNLLFSATFSKDITDLAGKLLHNPERIEVTPPNTTVERIEQRVFRLAANHKRSLLAHLITAGAWEQVLVFTRTKHGANRLAEYLDKHGLTAVAIHGNKSQNARTKALADFKAGDVRILVATDIAARGLDIDQLPHVVNFELPNVDEDYVHRIGRTGRAGRSGEAISLVAPDEEKLLKSIERMTKQKIADGDLMGFDSSAVEAEKPEVRERPDVRNPRNPRGPRGDGPNGSGGGGGRKDKGKDKGGKEKPAATGRGDRPAREHKPREGTPAREQQRPAPRAAADRAPDEFLDDDIDNFGNRVDYVPQAKPAQGRGRRPGAPAQGAGAPRTGQPQGRQNGPRNSSGATTGTPPAKRSGPRNGAPRDGQARREESRNRRPARDEQSRSEPAVQNPRGPAPKIIHKESKSDRFPTPEQLDQLPGRPRGEKPALLTRNR